MSSQWFEISNEGWRRMNAGRPPYELVKELIQNILDENFTKAFINFRIQGDDFVLEAEDDVVGGIANSALVTTVFLTGKEESHLKRGRKGRGLKEFLSVCYKAQVETVGKTISFCENGSREESLNNRQQGTKIVCYIREEGWNKKAIQDIEKYLEKVIVYGNGILSINGKVIPKRNTICSYKTELPTHIIQDGIQRTISSATTVNVYEKPSRVKGWIYEMGIPVTETDIPYDIDVQQRIPMNDNRNEISIEYLQDVKTTFVTSPMFSRLTKKDFLGWASDGLKSWRLDYFMQQQIAELIIEGSIHHAVTKSNKAIFNDKAKQKGKIVVDMKGMSDNLQRIVGYVVKDSERFIKDVEKDCRPVDVIATEAETTFMLEHKKLVKNALGLDINFKIVEKEKDTEGTWVGAFHESTSPVHTISYNRFAVGKTRIMGKDFFLNPYSVQALDLLIHELGHEKSECHDEKAYIDAVTNFGARISVYLMKKATSGAVKPIVIKKERKGNTVLDSIVSVMKKVNGSYLGLHEIYAALGADTDGAKAGIRGVLNRNCLTPDSIFERCSDGGMYKLRDSNDSNM